MRRHWQRAPLLIRQAIPDFEAPLDAAALIALAADDSVESRLVARRRGRWMLEHGPFDAGQLPPLSGRNWTLLVQGADLHSDAVHALLSRFRFLPDARLDDLMISLAADGGGVGPHLDSYDVFLLQAWGRRRWRIGRVAEPRLLPGLPLRILANFEAEQEWLLEPGDMLYLPPGWGHDGIAEGPCMTCSIGFRAPSRHEFLAAFLAEAADFPGGPDPRFGDRGRRAIDPAAAALIPDDLHGKLADWARRWRPTTAQIDEFIGRYLSEPKAGVWFDAPPSIGLRAFNRRIRRQGVALDRRTRMLWRGNTVYVNGEAERMTASTRTLLQRLAGRRHLGPADLQTVADDDELLPILHQWHKAGWLRLLPATKRP
ncbi:MAG TPA: cupin domain-containing protein [Burkholderiaceae bacterium]|nr:cupin domain-containing protein [Burkholderiaceae bacterium]